MSIALLKVEDISQLYSVCGSNDEHLEQLKRFFGVNVFVQGDTVYTDSVDQEQQHLLKKVLQQLHCYVCEGIDADRFLIEALLLEQKEDTHYSFSLNKTLVHTKNSHQVSYLKKLSQHELVFALGPAGTGKTYLAMAAALQQLFEKRKRCIILTRPVLEAGERLGFLPGSLADKIDPYLRPLYDALIRLVGVEKLEKLRHNHQLEIAPLAYMRGRTLEGAFVILDEAQNCDFQQLKLFLTRLGEGTSAVITGDPTQIDLRPASRSALLSTMRLLEHLPKVAVAEFGNRHVIRSKLVQQIVEAYQAVEHEQG